MKIDSTVAIYCHYLVSANGDFQLDLCVKIVLALVVNVRMKVALIDVPGVKSGPILECVIVGSIVIICIGNVPEVVAFVDTFPLALL